MTGFEPRTSGVGSDRSTNWATTISPSLDLFFLSLSCHHSIFLILTLSLFLILYLPPSLFLFYLNFSLLYSMSPNFFLHNSLRIYLRHTITFANGTYTRTQEKLSLSSANKGRRRHLKGVLAFEITFNTKPGHNLHKLMQTWIENDLAFGSMNSITRRSK